MGYTADRIYGARFCPAKIEQVSDGSYPKNIDTGSYPISEQFCCCLVVHLGPDDYWPYTNLDRIPNDLITDMKCISWYLSKLDTTLSALHAICPSSSLPLLGERGEERDWNVVVNRFIGNPGAKGAQQREGRGKRGKRAVLRLRNRR